MSGENGSNFVPVFCDIRPILFCGSGPPFFLLPDLTHSSPSSSPRPGSHPPAASLSGPSPFSTPPCPCSPRSRWLAMEGPCQGDGPRGDPRRRGRRAGAGPCPRRQGAEEGASQGADGGEAPRQPCWGGGGTRWLRRSHQRHACVSRRRREEDAGPCAVDL